ncbi:MAG: hypothetical protein LBL90_12070 [Prevotellaceae bacterium]|jgi:UbiD family decarboxylase|nr:hypothetical protein [Prevotellaceae bacterium]
MYESLERYIQFLQSKGELIRIQEFVDPVLQIVEIADHVSKSPRGGKPSLSSSIIITTGRLGYKNKAPSVIKRIIPPDRPVVP